MENQQDVIVMVVVMPIFFLFLSYLVKVIVDGRKTKLKSELHHKLVEKFGNVEELNRFLQSESGTDFLKSLTIEGVAPKEKLLSAITKGVILTFLGVALFLIGPLFPDLAEHGKIFNAAGIVAIALGFGYLVSTFISFRLSEKWGLIEKQ